MVTDIVNFLSSAVSSAMSMTNFIFHRLQMWPLVFSAISIVLITKFILAPILGFVASGASDTVKSAGAYARNSVKLSKARRNNKG